MTEPTNPKEEGPTSHDDWPRVLEWAEKQGIEALKSRFTTAELLSKDAQTLLTVLLAGIGGSLALALRILDPGPASLAAVGAAAVCAYLTLVGSILVMGGMRFRPYPAANQTPSNIITEENKSYTLDQIREEELRNLSERITEAADLNYDRAALLNKIKVMADASPLVFVLACALFGAKQTADAQRQALAKTNASAAKVETAASGEVAASTAASAIEATKRSSGRAP